MLEFIIVVTKCFIDDFQINFNHLPLPNFYMEKEFCIKHRAINLIGHFTVIALLAFIIFRPMLV